MDFRFSPLNVILIFQTVGNDGSRIIQYGIYHGQTGGHLDDVMCSEKPADRDKLAMIQFIERLGCINYVI